MCLHVCSYLNLNMKQQKQASFFRFLWYRLFMLLCGLLVLPLSSLVSSVKVAAFSEAVALHYSFEFSSAPTVWMPENNLSLLLDHANAALSDLPEGLGSVCLQLKTVNLLSACGILKDGMPSLICVLFVHFTSGGIIADFLPMHKLLDG